MPQIVHVSKLIFMQGLVGMKRGGNNDDYGVHVLLMKPYNTVHSQ